MCFFAGFLIDADHLIDYFITHPLTLDFRRIYKACLNVDMKRVLVIFHSFELAALVWAIGLLSPAGKIGIAAAVGISQHLILDQLFNPVRPLTYFLIYRISNGFKTECFMSTPRT